MSWLYVPDPPTCPSALAWGEPPSESDLHSPGLGAWATVSGKPSRRPYSWRGWRTRPWIRHLSGTISQPSRASSTADEWISSCPLIPAKRGAWLGSREVATTTATSGPTSCESSDLPGQMLLFERTSPGPDETRSSESSHSFESWATALRSDYSRRRKSVRRCEESDSCSWPRPTARGKKGRDLPNRAGGPSLAHAAEVDWPRPDAGVRTGYNQGGAAGRVGPKRPTIAQAAKDWPRRTKGDEDGSGSAAYSTESGRHSGTTLTDAAVRQFPCGPFLEIPSTQDGPGSQSTAPTSGLTLNPRFDEWLIGWPIGWTDPESPLSATEWTRYCSAMRSALLELG